MKFYMTPGSCTTGIHILLETLELPFEAWIVSIPAGDHLAPDYVAINPKSTIPTLVRDDGSALTEFQSIAWWLARTHPKSKLLPTDAEGETRVLEVMDFVVGTLHGQGFARIFATDKFATDPAQHEAVKARGREIVEQGFAIVDAQLPRLRELAGDFCIADAALFYVEFWAGHCGIELPPNCRAHFERMRARPVVAGVLREEGYR